jgi:hypothetical protein
MATIPPTPVPGARSSSPPQSIRDISPTKEEMMGASELVKPVPEEVTARRVAKNPGGP